MADYQFISERGLIIPDTSALRDHVIADFQAAFGNDIDTDPSSPSGLLIALHTEMRDAVARNNAELANQINPDLSTGTFLDALTALTNPEGRKPAVKSLLTGVVLSGSADTVVPAGTVCESEDGSKWQSLHQAVIPQGGTTTADFIAVEPGAIECQAHQLQTIVTGVLGLTSVDNPTAAVVGRDEETDAQLRRRRRLTLAKQSMSIGDAYKAHLYAIETVRSLSFLENTSPDPQTIAGIPMSPKSVWVCVEGGSDMEVARAIFDAKTAGAAYNGDVVVTVDGRWQDYEVRFDRPDEIDLLIRVTVKQSSFDAVSLVPKLIMNYVNGAIDGDEGFVVGEPVSPWEISGAINQQQPGLNVQLVEISRAGSGTWSSAVYPIAIDEVARTQATAITVLTV